MPSIFFTGFPGFLGSELLPRVLARTDDDALCLVQPIFRPLAAGIKVNVTGTARVLDLAASAPRLERMHYISTCYFSGRHRGIFREDDLQTGQTFNNFYEETKHLAEVEVRRRMGDGLPATIYRPSVVGGDSSTGATQKFDGPYFILPSLMRQPKVLDYFVHPTIYDTANMTADLAGTGVVAPRPGDYAPRLLDFRRAHREIGSAAMV